MNISEIIILSTPLVIVLLSLSFMPMIAPKFWAKNENLMFVILSCISIISVYAILSNANDILIHALIGDYVPFIIMIFTLYVLSNGIHLDIKSSSNTMANVVFLAISSFLSSFIGTTGASVLFFAPFLRINKDRTHKAHLVLFYIFLVSNLGGLLTPLGDSPLLLGYLHGVDFSWALRNLTGYWIIYTIFCLAVLYVIDKIILKKEETEHHLRKRKFSLRITGWQNVALLAMTVLVLFLDFDGEVGLSLPFIGSYVVSHICIKNIILMIFCGISFLTRNKRNEPMDLSPCKEVAKTFLVIFIVIAPVLFLLSENSEAIHKFMVGMGSDNDATHEYFWACAITSAFLDNAPSFLLFFNIAGGNANELMHSSSNLLSAMSVSCVAMGALTYIGNAPNLIVRSIARKNGITMPSFIGYMGWACLVILPISVLLVHLIAK